MFLNVYFYNTWIDGLDMINQEVKDFEHEFIDNESCLEWLKNQLYPDGIECPRCQRVIKHHKVSKRPCYACDNCGHHIHPTAGTIFHKSTTPLKTWFAIIYKLSSAKNGISAKEIQKEYGLTYKTARRILQRIRGLLDENPSNFFEASVNKVYRRGNLRELPDRGVRDKKPVTSTQRGKLEEHHSKYNRKRDRTARLLKLQMLLMQYPRGLEVKEIASKCSISKRTVYRDLMALESEIGVPIWEQGSKRGVIKDSLLQSITFTSEEATNIFLTVRLMQNYCYIFNPSVISTFNKLKTVVQEPLQKWIQNTIDHIESQPRDERKINNFNRLAKAWLSQHSVEFRYQEPHQEKPGNYIVNPYYIEPSVIGHSSYIIAYCHSEKSISIFKLDHIIGDVTISTDKFELPSDFEITNYFSSQWENMIMQPIVVKLRFTANIGKAIVNTIWHPSQKTELFSDGSGILTLKVRRTRYFRDWVMG